MSKDGVLFTWSEMSEVTSEIQFLAVLDGLLTIKYLACRARIWNSNPRIVSAMSDGLASEESKQN